MKNHIPISPLKNLYSHINSRRKFQFFLLLLLTIFAGFTEILSIASIVPFVKLVTEQGFSAQSIYISKLIDIENKQEAVIITGLIFSFLFFINSFSRIGLIYITSRLSQIIAAELSVKLYKAKLYDTYSNHISKNSNALIAAVTQKVYQIAITIAGVITFISGAIIFICIMIVLIWVNPKIMIISISFFGILYFLIIKLAKETIRRSGQIVNDTQNIIVKNLQNGLGGIRDIILDKTQNYYLKNFQKDSFLKARKQALIEFIQNSPRYIFESMGIALFVILLIYWNEPSNSSEEISSIFPTLAALAIGSQRILPLLNQLYVNFLNVKSTIYQIDEVVTSLNEFSEKQSKDNNIKNLDISFNKSILFQNVSFAYDKKKIIFDDINIEIKKGSKVGFIGKTGEGKSTFLDLLMGLLKPDKGSIYIDSKKLEFQTYNSWQSKISHVPQNIFLSNATFFENIAFGRDFDKIDMQKVELASKKSQIHEFIVKDGQGYSRNVGERGIRLSGGQIQRIGLARALYKDAKLIIFDEATNSLDSETERLIMDELYDLGGDLTMIIVAHRLNTLEKCDKIYEIKDNKIFEVKK